MRFILSGARQRAKHEAPLKVVVEARQKGLHGMQTTEGAFGEILFSYTLRLRPARAFPSANIMNQAKCDAYLNPDQPCSRCLKVKTQCIVSDPFKREHKRQRLSELEHETDELRRKLRSSASTDPHPSPIALLTAAAEMGVHSESSGGDLQLSTPPNHPQASSYPQQLLSPGCSDPSLGRVETPTDRVADPTISRTLNNIEVTGEEIDEMFHLFFNRYAQLLPILDPRTTPNSYYTQSAFLFWAMIGVACRTYPRNPTLLTALSRSITDMALLSVASTSSPWHTIQGLLLILTWPFPKDRSRPDVTFPLSGMLLHTAMQNGIHIPMSSHEFSKVKIPAPSETDMIKRSELWAHCVIVYQRACVSKGQSARTLANLEQGPGQSQLLFQKIAPSLALKVKCQEILSRCSAAVLENGVRNMSLDQERALDILIREFENQATDLETQITSEDDRFHTTLCRLSMQVYHFFKNHTIASTGCLPRLLSTACTVVDSILTLGERLDDLSTAPVQVNFGLLVASVSLLRILKSSASHTLDHEKARSSFFTAINLTKQMSIESNDVPAKTVIVLNQLWNSSKAFRKSDGSEYTALRIRSRLVFSVVLDAVWWWRDEFDAQYRAMVVPQEEAADGIDPGRENPGAATSAAVGSIERQEPIRFDDQFLADFEWALGDDGIFPPTEPYSSTFSSTGILL
ncbi:hypothetical protein MW887_000669 [Aspergillus wentii]|nr:hypothetical protein MW887_000669 [Aspergillus wentii]